MRVVKRNGYLLKRLGSGRSLAFTADGQRITLPAGVSLKGSSTATVEFWWKPTGNPGTGFPPPIYVEYTSSTQGYVRFSVLQISATEILAAARDTNSGTVFSISYNQLKLNTWHHIALTYDESSDLMVLYVDTQIVGTHTTPKAAFTTTTPLSIDIGGPINPGDPSLRGVIDELRIWNVARTKDQIVANMFDEIQPQSGLLAYYKVESNTGNLIDYSGNGFHGTITGTPTRNTSDSPVNLKIVGISDEIEGDAPPEEEEPYEPVAWGSLFNDSFARASLGSDYAADGAGTWTTDGVKLNTATGNAFGNNRLRRAYTNSFESWSESVTYTLPALSTSTIGLGIGFYDYNTASRDATQRTLFARLVTNTDSGSYRKVVIYKSNGTALTTLATSAGQLTINAGESFTTTVTKSNDGTNFICTATVKRNLDNSTISVSWTELGGNTEANIGPATGDFALFNLGGSYSITNWTTTISDLKDISNLFVGEGFTYKRDATAVNNRFANLVSQSQVSAGSSDWTQRVLDKIQNIIDYNPKRVLLNIGWTDIAYGVSSSTWQSNYSSIVSQIKTAGIDVIHLTPMPIATTDVRPLRTFIYDTFPDDLKIDLFTVLKGAGDYDMNTTYKDASSVYLNNVGHALVATTINNAGLNNTTPAAPTLTVDDNLNTLSASHDLGTSEIMVSVNSGAYSAYTGTINVGNNDRKAGYWKFKIKSATGRNESSVVSSPVFSIQTESIDQLVGVTNSETSITLMWSNMSSSYELQRSTSEDYSGSTTIYTGSNTYYTNTGLTPGTIYYYRVRKSGGDWLTWNKSAPLLYELFEGTEAATFTNFTKSDGTWVYEADMLKAYKGAGTDSFATKNIGSNTYVLYAYIHSMNSVVTPAGVVVRYVDSNNYWLIRWHQGNNSFELLERTSGTFTSRASFSVTEFAPNEPYEVKITVSPTSIEARLQHYQIDLSYNSTQHASSTTVGYRTIATSGSPDRFGYLVVHPVDVRETQFKPFGILEYFQEPVAVHFEGKFNRTYETWVSRWGDAMVRYFDHNAQKYSHPQVAVQLQIPWGIRAHDDHNPPAMHIFPDGEIMIWHTIHDIEDCFFQQRTSITEDIRSFGQPMTINDNVGAVKYNYPQPLELSDGSLVIFYRRGYYDNSLWAYKRSSDRGSNWSTAVVYVDNRPDGVYSYVSQNPNNLNEIHIAGYLSYENESPTGPWRVNIWYAKNDNILTGDVWKKSTGATYTLPFDETTMEYVLPGTVNNLVTDIKVIDNKPYIAYGYDVDPNHKLKWAELSGGVWVHREVAPSRQIYPEMLAAQYTPSIIINPEDPYEVAVCTLRTNLEVEIWRSSDNGATWAMYQQLTTNSVYDNFRIQWIKDALPDHRFIWCGGGDYTGLTANAYWTGYDNIRIQSLKDKI